ncbi:cytochrome C [Candidatus Methylomirabilis lanthanidiphila]|uniref:Cytochrome C n=1 Tax=Candidatus Methylomirabilis lanthanidiphila TaxID=2211376 RepID=A0A564ZIB5_9BACT|nr:hypothetical protein [Candidatus Methylomirabilis lanthanidiphila]VUZ85081.1 cytochrome C [Candidatus Methylomirabilis lanthanidiphila]
MADVKENTTPKPSAQSSGAKEPIVADRVHVWPYLVRNEFICSIIVMVILTVWSIVIDAPLEEPANPTQTPNPSKAPWYFLGLQEMLVYFDPWFAGVVLPSLIIVGLMVIPYVDINPKGNGYYTFKERPFAITTFLFGFFFLWISLIITGVFFRGPGWNLFWPWETWDPHMVIALTNIDLPAWGPFKWMGNPKIFGIEVIGFVLIALYSSTAFVFYYVKRDMSETIRQLGPVRYGIVAFLFLTMMSLPIKMFLRLAFNIQNIWVTPWFNI